uniref:Secreted protein n=1 Tax=Rhipicephalus microplus TaxID=6941 RepID=A0A6G5A2X3_RHIMP
MFCLFLLQIRSLFLENVSSAGYVVPINFHHVVSNLVTKNYCWVAKNNFSFQILQMCCCSCLVRINKTLMNSFLGFAFIGNILTFLLCRLFHAVIFWLRFFRKCFTRTTILHTLHHWCLFENLTF